MQIYVLAALWAAASYVVYMVVASFITQRRRVAEAARLGCQEPPTIPTKYPFGIDRVMEAFKADKAQLFTEMLAGRFALLSQGRTKEQGPCTTFQYTILGTHGVFTIDPKNVQAILATQFQDFSLGDSRRGNFAPLLGGNGIFVADGKMWEHSRGMMRPQFARDQVSDLELEEVHVQNMMRALPVNSDGWTDKVDLQVLFFRLTLDSACEFLFGESVDSQVLNLPGAKAPTGTTSSIKDEKIFATAFDVSQRWLARRVRLMELYWLLSGKEFKSSCKSVHDFVDYFVELALNKQLKEKELEKGGKKEKYVFLEALAAQTRDPIELRSQLLNILLAGRDTTASLLGWVFLLLARNPEIYQKLRQEVLNDFGSYQDSHELTFSKLKSCTYLQQVLNETLRLYPVVPVNSRRAVRDTTIPRGGGPDGKSKVFIKKDEQVDYTVAVMHRRKDIWGEDADEFKPERWAGRKTGFEYLPFNGGPRICLGRELPLLDS
jgi:cytochrome P450